MGRNFLFGDFHGGVDGEDHYLKSKIFLEQKLLTKEDVVFFLGDAGITWFYPSVIAGYKKDMNLARSFAEKRYTLFIIPGNHDNYDIINNLPIEEKWSGIVYVLKTKKGDIYFAKRGEIYIINGKKIFTFSGAKTSDIEGRDSFADVGTFKRVKTRGYYGNDSGKLINKKITIGKVSYWPQELATKEEMDYALDSLSKHNYLVDFIFTHTCPTEILNETLHETEYNHGKFNDPTTDFLTLVCELTEFKEWHYGHLHHNYKVVNSDGLFQCHYKTVPKEIL